MDIELASKKYSEKEHTIDQRVAYLAFIAGANYVEANRWVSCSDELPKQNERVIIYNGNRKDQNTYVIDIAFYTYLKKEGGSFYCNNKHYKPIQDITKWMPLPKSPNETDWDHFSVKLTN